jgi:hypothetical protein
MAGRSLDVWHYPVSWHLGCDRLLGRQSLRFGPSCFLSCASGVSVTAVAIGRGSGPSCVIIGKQEFRVDLALNYWGVGVDLVETDDWSIHLGPLDIECEYDKFYDVDNDGIRPADLRLFSKVREPCECEREPPTAYGHLHRTLAPPRPLSYLPPRPHSAQAAARLNAIFIGARPRSSTVRPR